MITLDHCMDPHSLTIHKGGKFIGHLQWHEQRPPRLEIWQDNDGSPTVLDMDEVEAITRRWKEIVANGFKA